MEIRLTLPRLSSIIHCKPRQNPTSSNQNPCSVSFHLPTSSITSALTVARLSAQAAALNRVDVILEALPYIERFNGKTVVVKYGGAAMKSPDLCKSVMKDLVWLSRLGLRMVLVHGGGPEIDSWLARLGVEPQFINGLRVTDEMTMKVVEMVLVGKVNTSLVSLINLEKNATAVGLSGNDARLLTACPAPNAAALGFVGQVSNVNPAILHTILAGSHIPVIAPVAPDQAGQAYNINADTAAGEISAALGAEKLILMTDVAGIMEDRNDSNHFSYRMETTYFLTRGGYVHNRFSSLRPSVTSYSLLKPQSYVALRSSTRESTVRTSVFKDDLEIRWERYMRSCLELVTLSPLDVEYPEEVKEFFPIFSKCGFFLYRMIVQVRWLLKLSDIPEVKEVPKFSLDARTFLERIILEFRENNMHAVVENMEHIANPDVRGVLNFLREKCKDQSEISKVLQNYQGTCTPEMFMTAYRMMVKDAVHCVMFPVMSDLCKTLSTLAAEDKADYQVTYTPKMLLTAYEIIVKDATLSPLMPDLCKALSTLGEDNTYTSKMLLTGYGMIVKDATLSPIMPDPRKILSMLSQTHDQQARSSKPSIGKELALFFDKLIKQELASLAEQLSKVANFMMEIPVLAEFTGEKGNYLANKYPEIDWSHVAEEFVTSLGLKFSPDLQAKLLLIRMQYYTELLISMLDLNKILDDFNPIVIKGRTIESELSLSKILKAADKRTCRVSDNFVDVQFSPPDYRGILMLDAFTNPFPEDMTLVMGYSLVRCKILLQELKKLR
ncbi:hypothetical protein FCM35_KLT02506 [Carex littledalei]|uniref:acetylglutamate kinase n=1 Tax=Carex littledalei TaxID=544730 RepID=A0A833RC43_9POAL|nr:hypothetical protein FCM35_KLT02506 [Carex littledalei]